MGSTGGTQYPWSSATQTGTRGIQLLPATLDAGSRNYIYDISVEVTSACDGGLKKISHNLNATPANLDNETAGVTTLATFTY
jgi:hypothetical protein